MPARSCPVGAHDGADSAALYLAWLLVAERKARTRMTDTPTTAARRARASPSRTTSASSSRGSTCASPTASSPRSSARTPAASRRCCARSRGCCSPREGTVLLDGELIRSLPSKQVARRLGLLPQSSIAPDGITVADLVARGRYPHQRLLRQWSRDDERAVDGGPGRDERRRPRRPVRRRAVRRPAPARVDRDGARPGDADPAARRADDLPRHRPPGRGPGPVREPPRAGPHARRGPARPQPGLPLRDHLSRCATASSSRRGRRGTS